MVVLLLGPAAALEDSPSVSGTLRRGPATAEWVDEVRGGIAAAGDWKKALAWEAGSGGRGLP